MNSFGRASRPVRWPSAGRPNATGTPMAAPALSAVPCPAVPPVPSAGCRGKGLLCIPPAQGRPALAGTLSARSPVQNTHGMPLPSGPVVTHVESIRLAIRPVRVPRCPVQLPFTIPSFPSSSSAWSQAAAAPMALSSSSSAPPPSSAARPARPKRKEAPPLYNLTRGSKRKALDVAACDLEMERAMNTYVADWRSAGDTSEDYWKTWSQLHAVHWDGWRREAAPLIPLSALKIHVVGSLLKVGCYRSSHITSAATRWPPMPWLLWSTHSRSGQMSRLRMPRGEAFRAP